MAEPIHDESCGCEPEPEGMPCLSGCIGGTDHDAQRTYVSHAEGCPNATYPCEKCGCPRTKHEAYLRYLTEFAESANESLREFSAQAETERIKALCRVDKLEAEVARLEGLITTVRCHEGYAKSCQCPDVELHAEARAIKARQK